MMTLDLFKPPALEMPKPAVEGKSKTSGVSPWLTAIAYPLGYHVVLPSYFSNIEVTGQENIPKQGPVILAPTHRARWDALMLPYATGQYVSGRDLRFMVTHDEMKGIQGWFIRRLGGFAINPRHPAIATLRYGVEVLRRGEMMAIFPEGNIFHDNQVHCLKPGLARIAIQAQSTQPPLGVKIVPISLRYNPIIPERGCEAKITIGSPLKVADYCKGSAKKNAQSLTADLSCALKQLDQQSPF